MYMWFLVHVHVVPGACTCGSWCLYMWLIEVLYSCSSLRQTAPFWRAVR